MWRKVALLLSVLLPLTGSGEKRCLADEFGDITARLTAAETALESTQAALLNLATAIASEDVDVCLTDQACVDTTGRADATCEDYVCYIPPTPAPTEPPTESPTPSPTDSPTKKPTETTGEHDGCAAEEVDVERKYTIYSVTASSCHNASRCGQNLNDNELSYGKGDWLTANGQKVGAYVTLDLGASKNIRRLVIYNQNEYDNDDSNRNAKDVTISVGEHPTSMVPVRMARLQNSKQRPQPGTTIRFAQQQGRYVRITLNTFYTDSAYSGLVEVDVFGTSDDVMAYNIDSAVASKCYNNIRCASKLIDGVTTFGNGNDWLIRKADLGAYVTFDLGAIKSITQVELWNQNEYSDAQQAVNRDTKGVTIMVGETVEGLKTIKQVNMINSNKARPNDVPTTVSMDPTMGRFVRVRIDSTIVADAPYAGLMEVRISGPSSEDARLVVVETSASSCHNADRCHGNANDDKLDWNGRDWLTENNKKQNAWIQFKLEYAQGISRLEIYNQNEYADDARNRDAKGIEIAFGTEPTDLTTVWSGDLITNKGQKGADKERPTVIQISPVRYNVQYVRVTLKTFYSNNPYSGLTEVDIFGFPDDYRLAAPLSITSSSCHNDERCARGLIDGVITWGQDNQASDWITERNKKAGAWVQMDYGRPRPIVRFDIFNQNEYTDGQGDGNRDVKGITISAADNPADLDKDSAVVLLTDLMNSNGLRPNNVPTVVRLKQPLFYRYWRITLRTFYSNSPYAGLMEIETYSNSMSGYNSRMIKPVAAEASSCHNNNRCAANLSDGEITFNNNGRLDWLTANGKKQGAFITFDLGRAYRVMNLRIYNQNEYDGDSNRDAKDVTISYQNDAGDWVVWAKATLRNSNKARPQNTPTLVNPRVKVNAQKWRITLDTFYTNSAYSGLMEVEFSGEEICEDNSQMNVDGLEELKFQSITASSCHNNDRCADNLNDGYHTYGAGDWLTANGKKQDAFVTIDLGATKTVWRMMVWNQGEYDGDSSRDVKQIEIRAADTLLGLNSALAKVKLATLANPNKARPFEPTAVSISAVGRRSRYWRVILKTFYTNSAYAGLYEIKMFGQTNVRDHGLLPVDSVNSSSCHNNVRCANSLIDGKTDYAGNDWLTQNGKKQGAWVTFDLGQRRSVYTMEIYNQNEYNNQNNRDVKGISIYYGDHLNSMKLAKTVELENSNKARPNPPSVVRVGKSGQYWKIVLESFYSNNAYAGLMEVDFYGLLGNSKSKYRTYGVETSGCHNDNRCAGQGNDDQITFNAGGARDWLTPNGKKQDAWIRLDLGKQRVISALYIYNQNEYQDGKRDAKDVEIRIGDAPNQMRLAETATLANTLGARPNFPTIVRIKPNYLGRYVQITLKTFYSNDPYSGLMEVDVWGPDNEEVQYAIADVTASTCHNDNRCHPALNDGTVTFGDNGVYDWLTANGKKAGAYATLDLGNSYHVSRLEIYNQNEYDGAANRDAKGITISAGDDLDDLAAIKTVDLANSNKARPNVPTIVFLDHDIKARYFRITLNTFYTNSAYSGLMEVQVFGTDTFAPRRLPVQYAIANSCYSATRCAGNISDGEVTYGASGDWLFRKSDVPGGKPYIDLDLGRQRQVLRFDIYNQNEYDGNSNRDAKGFILYAAEARADLGQAATKVFQGELRNSNKQRPQKPTAVDIPANKNVGRYWRIEITSYYTNSAYSGLVEVDVFGY